MKNKIKLVSGILALSITALSVAAPAMDFDTIKVLVGKVGQPYGTDNLTLSVSSTYPDPNIYKLQTIETQFTYSDQPNNAASLVVNDPTQAAHVTVNAAVSIPNAMYGSLTVTFNPFSYTIQNGQFTKDNQTQTAYGSNNTVTYVCFMAPANSGDNQPTLALACAIQ